MKLASELPQMPKNWLPDSVIVKGENEIEGRKLYLQFVITPDMISQPELLMYKLELFRSAFWEAIHASGPGE